MTDPLALHPLELSGRKIELPTIIDAIPSMVVYWDKELRCQFGNEAFIQWLGPTHICKPGTHIREIIGEERYQLNLPYLEGALRGEHQRFERLVPSADGSSAQHYVIDYVPDVVSGETVGFLALLTDISAQKDTQRMLAESEARYRAIVQDQTELISRFTPDGNFLFVGEAFCSFFGKVENDLLRSTWRDLAQPEDLDGIQAKLSQLSTIYPVVLIEKQLKNAFGELRWIQFTNRGLFEQEGKLREILSVGRDITELKQAEVRLRESEERYKALVTKTSCFTWSCPPSGLHVDAQPSFMAFTGQTEAEMLGDGWSKAVHPDDLSRVFESWEYAVANGEPCRSLHRMRRHDGAWRWIDVQAVPVCDASGQILAWSGFGQDVTERVLAERELQESEERLEAALEGSDLVSWDWVIQDKRVLVDRRIKNLLGFSNSEWNSRGGLFRLLHPDDLETVKQSLIANLKGNLPKLSIEFRLRHVLGHWVATEATGRVIRRTADGMKALRMVGTLRDVTLRERLKDEGTQLLKQIELLICQATKSQASSNVPKQFPLTRRQRQIIALIAKGMTSAAIAQQLQVAKATIITHRRDLMQRLGLHSAAELTRFAIENDIVDT